jgi:hypothetical protein
MKGAEVSHIDAACTGLCHNLHAPTQAQAEPKAYLWSFTALSIASVPLMFPVMVLQVQDGICALVRGIEAGALHAAQVFEALMCESLLQVTRYHV